jgi:hypothetical protein
MKVLKRRYETVAVPTEADDKYELAHWKELYRIKSELAKEHEAYSMHLRGMIVRIKQEAVDRCHKCHLKESPDG